MIDPSLVARVRAEVASGLDPSVMLLLYADPARRLTLRERVRATVVGELSEDQLEALCAELFGFGPVQPLLDDAGVTDVLVNGPKHVFVERDGRLEHVDVVFRDAAAVSELAHRIAAGVGRELTIERPYVDARMRDGSRANAVIAPVGGPTISIRKFTRVSLALRGPAPSWEASNGLASEAAELMGAGENDHLLDELATLKSHIIQSSGIHDTLRGWSEGMVGDKTFQQINEEFAEIVIPKVWMREEKKISRVAECLSISPKKVRRILRNAGYLDVL